MQISELIQRLETIRGVAMTTGYSDLNLAKLLLADERVDPSVWNNEALRYAMKGRNIAMIDLLMADPRVASTWDKARTNFFKSEVNK